MSDGASTPVDSGTPRPWPPSLWLLAPPMGIFLVSVVIFSSTAFGISELVHAVGTTLQSQSRSIDPFAEMHARMSWAATVFLVYGSFGGVGIYSARLVWLHRGAQGLITLIVAGIGMGLVLLGYFIYSGAAENNFSYIFRFTYESLVASGYYSENQLLAVRLLLLILNSLAGLVPVLGLITAGCCVLSPRQSGTLTPVERLRDQIRHLKTIVGLGSLLMVAGVLHMMAWLSWPAGLMKAQPDAMRVAQFSHGMGLYWGVTFTLIIAAFYLPAIWTVYQRAEKCYQDERPTLPKPTMDLAAWMRQEGLALAPLQQLPPLLAVFAPLLAEPLGSLLANLSIAG